MNNEGDFIMKKLIILMICFILGIMIYNKNQEIIIPNNAIRIRIIANSNNISDLYNKMKLKEEIKNDIYDLVSNVDNISEARLNIKNNIDNIDKIVSNKISNYKIDYGMNYFPKKSYKGVVYQEGEYESLVITLGEGLGDNWWCVLYPPLCLIDENEMTSDVEYRSLIYDLLSNN